MAKNYTMTEVAIAIATKNEQAIADIGKRYPLLAHKMTALVTKAPDETVDIFNYMPEYLSANKVNKLITTKSDEDVTSDEDAGDDVEEEVTEEPKKAKKPAAKKEEVTESDGGYDTMSTNQLYTILGDLGERKNCKAEFGDFKKASMAAYLAKHHPNGVGEGDEDEPDEEVEEEEATGKYDGKKAPELYSLCKKRKIKAEAKKPAKYYIELLEKADEAEAKKAAKKPAKKEEPEEEEDDDWGDDDAAEDVAEEPAEDDEWEDVKEKPKAKPGRPKKAAAKPKATTKKKEEEPDDDDDDDWDI